ncbi:MAG: type III pantothenate kinase [Acidobacteria bacterium]|nr:type III pantothenate kinase [Candidatus Sulfomarinibacter sp. MAG AM2]
MLALDVGNTNTVVGLFEGEALKTHWRLTTHAERTADEVGVWLLQLLRWECVEPGDLTDVAVYAEYGGPCLVLDFGTAITWEVVSAGGEYLGGVIAPGPGVTADALSTKTAKLPQVAMEPPERVIGKGTVDSIQSGLFYGYLGLIEGVTRRILDELGEATVVATGGLAGAFASETDLIHHVEPDLTLHGLRQLWALNRGETA